MPGSYELPGTGRLCTSVMSRTRTYA